MSESERERVRESESERERVRESERVRERVRESERERVRERDRGEKERRVARLQIFNTEFSLSQDSVPPALRTMVFDVAKLESMLRDTLDEVSGLETMLVTARAWVRRNEAPFSFEAFGSKKFLSEHPFS